MKIRREISFTFLFWQRFENQKIKEYQNYIGNDMLLRFMRDEMGFMSDELCNKLLLIVQDSTLMVIQLRNDDD